MTDALIFLTGWTLVSLSIGGIYALLMMRLPRRLEIDFTHGEAYTK